MYRILLCGGVKCDVYMGVCGAYGVQNFFVLSHTWSVTCVMWMCVVSLFESWEAGLFSLLVPPPQSLDSVRPSFLSGCLLQCAVPFRSFSVPFPQIICVIRHVH